MEFSIIYHAVSIQLRLHVLYASQRPLLWACGNAYQARPFPPTMDELTSEGMEKSYTTFIMLNGGVVNIWLPLAPGKPWQLQGLPRTHGDLRKHALHL